MSAAPNKRQLAKARTAEKIKSAARRLFDDVGYEQATIRGIAAAAAMSTGAVFSIWKGKAALYTEIYGVPPLLGEQPMLLLDRCQAAILEINRSFGAPGDYGYGTRQGAALSGLYDVHNAIVAVRPQKRAAS